MFEEFGNIGLSRDQFRELVLTYIVGMHIRRRAAALKDEDRTDLEDLERHLLAFAAGFEAEDMVERSADSLYPGKALENNCHSILELRDNEYFWDRLQDELAWRDFLLTLPAEERLAVADSGLKPPKGFYDQYAKEFDKYGADRLVVDPNLPASEG